MQGESAPEANPGPAGGRSPRPRMRVTLIAAIADNGVIGHGNDLPWHLPADLRRFKRLTMGHHLILGRKTFDSIGRALPGRRMLVLSRGRPRLPEGVHHAATFESALERARQAGDDEAFVAGGAEIYRLALPRADRLQLTRVHAEVEGDVRFPEVDWSAWERLAAEEHAADERHAAAFTFELWQRQSR